MNFVSKIFYVYILCNRHRNVLYVGKTNNLKNRIYFHKKRLISGFTKKYNVDQLIYYEEFSTSDEALARESQIKKYRREKKNNLILKLNPDWEDLYNNIQT
jgi:putative endonuclease